MTKEELEFLITNASQENLQNYYLKGLLDGRIAGPLTNKPSKDRPWLANFSDEEVLKRVQPKTIYQDLIDSNKNNLNSIAIEFYGTKITYQELINNIEKTASALKQMGVKKGDTVTISMPYLPETVYTIYAINKLGAVVNIVDPRINKELMTEYIDKSNSEYAIIISKIEDKINSIKPKTKLKKIISVPATNSVKSKLLKIPDKLKDTKFISWNDFITLGTDKVSTIEYEPNKLAVIEYTSGTSGKPKGVMLSNESLVELSHSSRISYKCQVNDKFLLIMPPFIAYGLAIGMHDMLCMGQHLLMIPNFTLDKASKMFPKILNKYKPNYIMGVPNFLLFLLNYNNDLSFLKGIIIGGDHLDEKLEKKVYQKFPNLKIFKGWGMTEIASCGVFTKTDIENPYGSVGIPLLGNVVKILPLDENNNYDIDGRECSYNEDGLLFINSPTRTLGYYLNEEETNKLIVTDKEGNKWINTGDVFSINEKGYLFFKNRIKRIVVRPDGHNIPSTQIENIALNTPGVLKSIVIGVPSKKYDHGKQAALCVKIQDNNMTYEEIKKLFQEIEYNCTEELQPRDRPKYIISLDEVPLTPNGKVDYNKISEIANKEIDKIIYVEESENMIYVINRVPTHVKTRRKIFKSQKNN